MVIKFLKIKSQGTVEGGRNQRDTIATSNYYNVPVSYVCS